MMFMKQKLPTEADCFGRFFINLGDLNLRFEIYNLKKGRSDIPKKSSKCEPNEVFGGHKFVMLNVLNYDLHELNKNS